MRIGLAEIGKMGAAIGVPPFVWDHTCTLTEAADVFITMLDAAAARGIELPVAAGTLACFREASDAGWGGRDGTSLPARWASKAG